MLKYSSQAYQLTFAEDRPYVYVDTGEGKRLMELFVLSGVNAVHQREDTLKIETWQKQAQSHATLFELKVKSSLWSSKTIRFFCRPERFTYIVEVEGQGDIFDVNYFGGYYSGHVRWGSGFFYSGNTFKKGFNPEPDTQENYFFSPSAGSQINLTGVPLPGKADWFFTPPPFCFSFEHEDGWIGMGLEASPGENQFTGYEYRGMGDAFYLQVPYEGHTHVEGCYTLPAIGFDFRKDPYDALQAHVEANCSWDIKKNNIPDWWYSPIFCGWGEQCYHASLEKGHAPNYSRQELYVQFLQTLKKNQIFPGIVVLDDKWQLTYGENQADPQKWPDIKGFIQNQHNAGQKVLLWLKAWDPEGLPVAECVTNAAGVPVAFDPSNPRFEKRLRESVRKMISEDGYNADGFKIDFTARIPSGPDLKAYGKIWGLELLKAYLRILYEEAKKHKPDALIMSHTPHPYLADVVDMIRLNDINTGQPVNSAMRHRAYVASIACPNLIIDTDNWPMKDKAAWRNYVSIQPELGVPSLYFATHIDSTGEALEENDYLLIRDCWNQWKYKNDL
jgi:hypothetical protein